MSEINLLFLFMSQSSASPGMTPDNWKPDSECHDMYHARFSNEGYFKLLEKLLKMRIIDNLYVVYESNVGPGLAKWIDHPRAHCMVAPEIRFVEKYIDENTIIWVRGGFKHWHDWLLQYKGRNWLMLYAANTGRERWPWWDIVLDDITMKYSLDTYGRITVPFVKPIDDEFFCPMDIPYDYDVCIGASHIHDKKGQWRAVEAAWAYQRRYGEELRLVMPGVMRGGGINTRAMLGKIAGWRPVVDMPGHVHRSELRKIFNRSKMVAFLGAHGQNDRGPLEALSCGRPVIIGSPKYHTAWLKDLDNLSARTMRNVENIEEACSHMRDLMILSGHDKVTMPGKQHIRAQFNQMLSFDHSVRQMANLITLITSFHPSTQQKDTIFKLLGA